MLKRLHSFAVVAALLLFSLAPALAEVATTQVLVTPNTGAYSAGNCLGGVLPVAGMIRVAGQGGAVLGGFTFVDPAGQSAANDAMTLLIFNAAPTGTYTDHAGCAIAAVDVGKLVGVVVVASSACFADGTSPATTVCQVLPNAPITAGAQPVTSSNIWIVPIITATPTYGTTTLLFNFASISYSGN